MQQLPEHRPTATDILNNSWVRGEKTARYSMTETAQHLSEFNARRKFKVLLHASIKLTTGRPNVTIA